MKKSITTVFFLASLFLVSTSSFAQTSSLKKVAPDGKNLFKVNLTAIPLNNYSFIYERAIGKKIAVGLGFRFMPKGNIPLLSKLESTIDDPETFDQLKNFQTGNIAITPEIKFYFGKGVFRGFYIAPFVRYAQFNGNVPFNFEYDDDGNPATVDVSSKIDLDGKVTAITGGLLLGSQWKLSKLMYLNWEILGPAYGSSNGSITGTSSLLSNSQAREGLAEELKGLEDGSIPLVKITTAVSDKEARADFSGPWAGVKASIGLGFRF